MVSWKSIAPVTIKGYSDMALPLISFPVRVLDHLHSGDESWRAFKLKQSPDLLQKLSYLYVALVNYIDGEDDAALANAMHQYLWALVQEHIPSNDRIANTVDQVLCFGALRDSPDFETSKTLNFQSASRFTVRCAAIQHLCVATFLQQVHMESEEMGEYRPNGWC